MGYRMSTFEYGGIKYYFNVSLTSPTLKTPDAQNTSIVLDTDYISSFEYVNEINSYCPTGIIKYIDNKGILDKFIDDQNVYCDVTFSAINQKADGSFYVESTLSPEEQFSHRFIVENIEIAKRTNDVITYFIYLTSINWLICSNNILHSTYHLSNDQSVLDVLKSCINSTNMLSTADQFSNINTEVMLDYITNGNDNLFTITKYLLNRLYFYQKTDDSLKFIVYDEFENNIRLCDLKDSKTSKNSYPVILSFYKTGIENFEGTFPVNLGTVVKKSKLDTYQTTMFSRDIYNYNYNTNEISNLNVNNFMSLDNNLEYLNNTTEKNKNDNTKKYFNLNNFSNFNNYLNSNIKRTTYWNDSYLNIYTEFIDSLLNDNAFIVNTTGKLNRIPGDYVTVSTDKNSNFIENENIDTLNEFKHKYEYFNGVWIVGKIRHIIEPTKSKFTQNLVLIKNFNTVF